MDEENEIEQEKIRKQTELIVQQHLDDLRFLMQTDAGIRFFRNLIAMSGIFSTKVNFDNSLYFYEGMRNIVNRIIADISIAAPEKVNLLFQGLQPAERVKDERGTKLTRKQQ